MNERTEAAITEDLSPDDARLQRLSDACRGGSE